MPAARAAVAALVAAALGLTPPAAHAQSLADAVKATYLFKLGPFVAWPPRSFPTAAAPFTVCLLGEDPFGPALVQAIRGQTVAGRPITLRHLEVATRTADCQVLYIGRSRQQSPEDAIRSLGGAPVLTVTDERSGVVGMINFVVVGGRVRFSINEGAARASGLVLSSQLLALATFVDRGGG